MYNLGLIYEINLDETGLYQIVMTFTDTACDCAESLPIEIVAGQETNRELSKMSRLKLPGRLLGRLHESVATAVLPLGCHLVKQAKSLFEEDEKASQNGLLLTLNENQRAN